LEGVNIRIKKVLLIISSIITILLLLGLSRSLFNDDVNDVSEIRQSDLSLAFSRAGDNLNDRRFILGKYEEQGDWISASEFMSNYKAIVDNNDTFYLRIKLQEYKLTNPAVYFEGIKASSYTAYFNGRVVYKSYYNRLGKDLDLDTTYMDVVIPLGKLNMSEGFDITDSSNSFNEEYLILKLDKGNNKNIMISVEKKSVLIGEHKDIIAFTLLNGINRIFLNSIIAAIAMICAIVGFVFKGRDRKILLGLSLFCICMVGYGVGGISHINSIFLDAPFIWSYLIFTSLACAPYIFSYFFEALFGDVRKGLIKAIRKFQFFASILLIGSLLLFTITRGQIDIIQITLYIFYIPLLALIVAVLTIAIKGVIRRDSEAIIFTIGITVYICDIVYGMVRNALINENGLLVFIVSMIVITAKRFFKMNQSIIKNAEELEFKNSELHLAWEEISASKEEIFELNKTLEQRVNDRTKALEGANMELKEAMEKLKHTQDKLIQSEKMVALGELVAGVSHEINTPIGISVTAASHLHEKTRDINKLYTDSSMKRSDLEKYLNVTTEATEAILSNLQRAAELVKSFKQVAVDQSEEKKRSFKMNGYINQIILSLTPSLKKTKISIWVYCDEGLEINSYPGAISQIVTNLVMNSLVHGFDEGEEGTITFAIDKQDNNILFNYSDNGKGIPKEIIGKIFDPFFTTKRGSGGTGLGLNIVYNIVTQTLGGSIECISKIDAGTAFNITIPID
jgi:signal transduction histidine kinase